VRNERKPRKFDARKGKEKDEQEMMVGKERVKKLINKYSHFPSSP